MAHDYVLAILPEGYVKDVGKDQSRVEEFIAQKMARYDLGPYLGTIMTMGSMTIIAWGGD